MILAGTRLLQGLFPGALCPQGQVHAWEKPADLPGQEGSPGVGAGLGARLSSSMVWQVLEGLSADSAQKQHFVSGVVCVHEGAAWSQSLEVGGKALWG